MGMLLSGSALIRLLERLAEVVERWSVDERELAAMLGLSLVRPDPQLIMQIPHQRRVRDLIAIDALLDPNAAGDEPATWLRSPNSALAYRTPLEAMMTSSTGVHQVRLMIAQETLQ